MQIGLLRTAGIQEAIHAMRNPYDSWEKSDSTEQGIGDHDIELSLRLLQAGPEHCKHLRLIDAWAEVRAPRYWWQEFDTYRMGVDKVSCSTMHTITRHVFTEDDFEEGAIVRSAQILKILNHFRQNYMDSKEQNGKDNMDFWWRHIIEILPQSYLQTRTVKMSYQALAAMYQQRRHHKLREWHKFCKWIETLPCSILITGHDSDSPETE